MLVVGLMLAPDAARADGPPEVPIDQQVLIVLRILAYDANLAARSGTAIEIAVIHRADDAASEQASARAYRAFARAAGKLKVAGLPVRVMAIPYSATIADDLQRLHVDQIYVCAGLDAMVPAIAGAASSASALSFTDQPAYLEAGVAVALARGDHKVSINVNLVAAKAAGARLGANFLRLARVVKR